MNKVLTILKTGIICAGIIFILQSLTYWFFLEKFEEYYEYSPLLIVLLKIGMINLIIYLFFSAFVFNYFNHLSGNFILKSIFLMSFFVIFKTIPVVLNLFLSSEINLSFIFIFITMQILSDIISAFVFIGMFSETKIKAVDNNNYNQK